MSSKNSHILRAIDSNLRYDGRKKEDYRNVSIEYGVSSTAEGSAKVTIGQTEVLAGVKMELAKPYDDVPDAGTLMVEVQLLPLASPKFEAGPPGIDSIELARVTDRGIRESNCIDMKKLCIEPGEKVWSVIIDVVTLNADGNLFDACSLAVLAALKDTKIPIIGEDGKVDFDQKGTESVPLDKSPLGITVWKVGDNLVVDPTAVEEEIFDSRLTITTLEDGTICAMQKGGAGTLTVDDVNQISSLVKEKAAMLRKSL